jgi:hypothetical protein
MLPRAPRAACGLALAVSLLPAACGREEPAAPGSSPAGPTAAAVVTSGATTAAGGEEGRQLYSAAGVLERPGIIAFPPRNEPYAFRAELEAKYRDGLKRSPSSTYVDLEGDIVWTQEYLRYRVNQCDHAVAMDKVFSQIDGNGIAPVCGDPPQGAVPFPPRNEPYAFRQELERKYRDGLRRSATSSSVDIEGSIVWTQEYLRYRVNRCDHATAVAKVLSQIDGNGIAPTCIDALSGTWDGTSTYWNAPFRMEMSLNGTVIGGRYYDQYDTGYLGGTYTDGAAVLILVNFGDTGIAFDGAFDGANRIKGVIRGGVLGRTFPFEMTRRP